MVTDNGSEFTDRFTNTNRSLFGPHAFDLACLSMGLDRRLCPPRHLQTNGMVERFNGCISDILKQTGFRSPADLDDTLKHYLLTYNHLIPQRALKHPSSIQSPHAWRAGKKEVFVKSTEKHPGLDSLQVR